MRHLVVLLCTGLFVSLAHADETIKAPCLEPNLPAPAQTTQQEANTFSDGTRLREIGLKGYLGKAHEGGPMGGALYVRAHRQGRKYGLEFSHDSISNNDFRQVALLRYFKDRTFHSKEWQPYIVLGGGSIHGFPLTEFVYTTGGIFEAGGGIDARLTKRFSLNADIRYFKASITTHNEVNFDTRSSSTLSFALLTASLGISIRFESPIARTGKAIKQVVSPYLR
jgi:hypothetical protein